MSSDLYTTHGTVLECGKKFEQSGEFSLFDFIELKLNDGTVEKLINVVVPKECMRGIKIGTEVGFVFIQNPSIRQAEFPSNKGGCILYVVINKTMGRTFSDIEMLDSQAKSLINRRSLVRCITGGIALAATIYALFTAQDKITGPAIMWVIMGVTYFMTGSTLTDKLKLYAPVGKAAEDVPGLEKLMAATAAS